MLNAAEVDCLTINIEILTLQGCPHPHPPHLNRTTWLEAGALIAATVLLSIISITSDVISHNIHTPFNVFLHNCGSYQDKEKRMSLNIQMLNIVKCWEYKWRVAFIGRVCAKNSSAGAQKFIAKFIDISSLLVFISNKQWEVFTVSRQFSWSLCQ